MGLKPLPPCPSVCPPCLPAAPICAASYLPPYPAHTLHTPTHTQILIALHAAASCSWANEGFLGVGLAYLVRGDMRWCLISNYMLDFAWLLSACPDLARAPRLLVVHGEHAGSNA